MIDYLNKETYNFYLPENLIATTPNYERDHCKLMILNKDTGKLEHKIFSDIINYLNKDDILVLNDSKVIPARIYAKKNTGGNSEILLLNKVDRDFAKDYVNFNGSYRLGLSAVRSAMASPANMVIFPIQDCLSLGREGRMNTPSTVSGGNWSWRLPKDALSEKLTRQLSNFTRVYKRC